MTHEQRKAIYAALAMPFPEEAIQRTDARATGKPYSTTGVGYAFVTARLNEVLGVGGYRSSQEFVVREITTAKGRAAFDCLCVLTLQLGTWDGGVFMPFAEAHATGGHQSMSEADARKGSFTNAFKKAAAMFGCGQQAYMGTLDDDNVPDDRSLDPRPSQPPRPTAPPPPPVRAVEQAPVPQQQHEEPPADGNRNRLTSKQLGAIQTLARKLGYQPAQFRQQVRETYGAQPEFLDRRQASELIGKLSARASNGGSHPAGEYGEVA